MCPQNLVYASWSLFFLIVSTVTTQSFHFANNKTTNPNSATLSVGAESIMKSTIYCHHRKNYSLVFDSRITVYPVCVCVCVRIQCVCASPMCVCVCVRERGACPVCVRV